MRLRAALEIQVRNWLVEIAIGNRWYWKPWGFANDERDWDTGTTSVRHYYWLCFEVGAEKRVRQ